MAILRRCVGRCLGGRGFGSLRRRCTPAGGGGLQTIHLMYTQSSFTIGLRLPVASCPSLSLETRVLAFFQSTETRCEFRVEDLRGDGNMLHEGTWPWMAHGNTIYMRHTAHFCDSRGVLSVVGRVARPCLPWPVPPTATPRWRCPEDCVGVTAHCSVLCPLGLRSRDPAAPSPASCMLQSAPPRPRIRESRISNGKWPMPDRWSRSRSRSCQSPLRPRKPERS